MALVSLFTVVAVSSCSKDDDNNSTPQGVEVTGVKLNSNVFTLDVGSSYELKATVSPEDADNKTIKWESSDDKTVSVTADGVITAVIEGKATITATATAGGKSDSCIVTVTPNFMEFSFRVEDGSTYSTKIDTVKLELEYRKNINTRVYDVMAKALYNNGNVTLKLPKTIDDKYLEKTVEYNLGEYNSDSIKVNKPEAKTTWGGDTYVYIYAYKTGRQIGGFYFNLDAGTTDSYYNSNIIYVSEDVEITGSETETRNYEPSEHTDEYGVKYISTYIDIYKNKYDLHLKKGWNKVYYKSSYNYHQEEENPDELTHKITYTYIYEYEYTTKLPTGAEEKWYFNEW
jgi:hypothetical protein